MKKILFNVSIIALFPSLAYAGDLQQTCIDQFLNDRDMCLADFSGKDRATCMQEATSKKQSCFAGIENEPNSFFTVILDDSGLNPDFSELTIQIDGETIDGDFVNGVFSTFLTPGSYDLKIFTSEGTATRQVITVAENTVYAETFFLKSESMGLLQDFEVRVTNADEDGVVDPDAIFEVGIFDLNGNALSFDNLSLALVTRIESGSFADKVGGTDVSDSLFVTDQFTFDDNTAKIIDSSQFATLVSSLGLGEYEMELSFYDSVNDLIYDGVVYFRFGNRIIEGSIDGPFGLDGHSIELESADGTISRTLISDNDGTFSFDRLPPAVYQISAVVDDGSNDVRSAATLVRTILGDKIVELFPITLNERDSGQPEAQVSELFSMARSTFSMTANDSLFRRQEHAKLSPSDEPQIFALAATTESISVTAGSEGQEQTGKATLEIPATSNSLTLEYSVSTEEYPEYVTQQSEFDDQWRVRVFDERGTPVFSSFSNVNSQLNSATKPELVWTGSGSTDTVKETIKLAELSNASDSQTRKIRIEASATNIGDGILPTTVDGTVSASAGLDLEWVNVFRTSPSTSVPKTVISIPDSGKKNTYSVLLSWAAKNAESGAAVPRSDFGDINAKIQLGSGGAKDDIFTHNGIGGPVTEGGQAGTFRTNITFTSPNPASPVNVSSPSQKKVQYEVKLTATIDDVEVSDTATSGTKTALYAGVLAGQTRAGGADNGGDDWASQPTYAWLQSNIGLLGSAIGDISGEHGRNIGHSTHKEGEDIDFRQWGSTYSGTGGAIYNKARNDAAAVIAGGDGAEAAKTRLTAFVSSQRSGIVSLVGNSDVKYLYGPHGVASGSLPSGWLNSLIRTGKFTATNTDKTEVNIGGSLGTTSSKYINRTQNDHNDHYHVRIKQN